MAPLSGFSHWLTEALTGNYYYRYVHGNGMGLMNNQALDYMRLSDEEEADVQDGYLALQQPRGVPAGAIFVFTADGVRQHAKLIKLLKKASRFGVRGTKLDPSRYKVIWDSGDGQLAVVPIK